MAKICGRPKTPSGFPCLAHSEAMGLKLVVLELKRTHFVFTKNQIYMLE